VALRCWLGGEALLVVVVVVVVVVVLWFDADRGRRMCHLADEEAAEESVEVVAATMCSDGTPGATAAAAPRCTTST